MVTDTVKRILLNQLQAVESEIISLKSNIRKTSKDLEESNRRLLVSENIAEEIKTALKD